MISQIQPRPAAQVANSNFASRIAPAIGLFFLAPLIAEFLLGNLPIKLLPALILLAPFYGGAALLIRESVRRAKRGWSSIFLLGLAYAVLEEAFTTQSLFNHDYLRLNMHLLDSAYIPALGIGGWWTMLMLNLHPIWSIATPIALMEALVPRRAQVAWLGRTGFIVTALIFALGATAMTMMTIKKDPFTATHLQLACAAVVVAGLIAAAFLIPRSPNAEAGDGVQSAPNPPSPWIVGAFALAAGSAVLLVPNRWGWGAAIALLAIDVIAATVVLWWSRRRRWSALHQLALASGAALAYSWHAFVQTPVLGGATVSARIGNVIFAVAAITLIWLAAKRTSAALRTGQTAPASSSEML